MKTEIQIRDIVSNGDVVLGHILFSLVTTTPPSGTKGLGLAPVAVHPDLQSQGIGTKLIREGLRLCRLADRVWWGLFALHLNLTGFLFK